METLIDRPITKKERAIRAIQNPLQIRRERNNRSFYEFLQYFWPVISNQPFVPNWHIEYECKIAEYIVHRVGQRLPKTYDYLFNVPPGTTKTVTWSIMLQPWAWTQYFWMRFITASYSNALSLESAEYSRDLMRSERFRMLYPELEIKEDKDTKSNFKIVKKEWRKAGFLPQLLMGGNRYSTSVGGTLTGFHADIIVWDDPLNPQEAFSEKELINTNRWIDQTLPTRKTDKKISTIIGIMQRLHQDDPTGHILAKKKKNVKHVCLPGEIVHYKDYLNPPELADKYVDGLLDPNRLDWEILKDLEADLGQYGYAGQIGQNPTPPGGGMFKVDHFAIIQVMPTPVTVMQTVRYWDKAGTHKGGCFTVGVKMCRLANKHYIVMDVKRGQWSSEEREQIIKETSIADGENIIQIVEKEGGSGGKESAEATVRNLAGYNIEADAPQGDKVARADPYSVQVNWGNVQLLIGEWNHEYIEEFRFFPFSKYKDQVDASSGAFKRLSVLQVAGRVV